MARELTAVERKLFEDVFGSINAPTDAIKNIIPQVVATDSAFVIALCTEKPVINARNNPSRNKLYGGTYLGNIDTFAKLLQKNWYMDADHPSNIAVIHITDGFGDLTDLWIILPPRSDD